MKWLLNQLSLDNNPNLVSGYFFLFLYTVLHLDRLYGGKPWDIITPTAVQRNLN